MIRRRWFQRILLVVILVLMVAIVSVFIGYRHMTHDPATLLELVKNDADMHLSKIQQTAMKNGIREWYLDAESATLLEKEKTVLLTNPKVEFFMKDGDIVHLTAHQGKIYTESNRLSVQGEVAANTSLYRFRTDSLDYDPATRQLHSATPVTIIGNLFSLTANRMSMELETDIMRFDGGVKGVISEDFEL